MSKTKAFYIDFNKGNLCNDQGGVSYNYPSIAYQAAPTWELNFLDIEDGYIFKPDMSDASAWRAAVDVDFTQSTEPLMRTLADGIDSSKAASGIISVDLNAGTSGVQMAVDGHDSIRAYFELRGYDLSAKCIYDYRFRVDLKGAIDPTGGDPIPLESGGVTLTDVYAIANGAVASAGHVTSAEMMSELTNYALISALNLKQDLITNSAKLDYSLLSSTPTIPTVNNATITFTQGGTTKGTINLNQASNQTIAFDAGGGGGGGVDAYTKAETDALLTGKADLSAFNAHVNDSTIHVTQMEKDLWNSISGLTPASDLSASGGSMDFAGMNGEWVTTLSTTTIDGNNYPIYTKTYNGTTYYLQYVYSSFQGYNMWVITNSIITTPTNWPPSTSEASLCYATNSTTDLNNVSFSVGSYEGITPSFTLAGGGGSDIPNNIVLGKNNGVATSGIVIDIVSSLPVTPDANTLYFIG